MLSWFKKKSSEENYEQILASLELSIQKRQTQLSEIRLRERRTMLLVTMWAFSLWAGYVALWWAGVIGQRGGRGGKSVLWGLPVFVGPVLALFIRRIVQLWYTRKGNAEEKTLKELLVTQRNKIEEIKKKTNYYSTKSLLDRYDEGPKQNNGPPTPNAQRRIPNQPAQPAQPRTPIKPQVMTNGPQAGQVPVMQPQHNIPTIPYSPAIGQLPTPRKQWYDKLADALLGDDTASTGVSTASRYALICERCFTHNGLVKEDQWEDAQYLCPKCGHFNKSLRARKALQAAGSPITPSKPTSTSTVSALSSAPIPTSTVTSDASPAARSVVAQSDQPTQDTPSPPQPSQPQPPTATSPALLSTTTLRRRSEKSPLSESTVIVEKSDLEEMDVDM